MLTLVALFVIELLLRVAGEVHPNQGPANAKCANDLSVIYIHARCLRHKIDLLDCELEEHDIVTVSETWLPEEITNDEVDIDGFHPPIRKDGGKGDKAVLPSM